MSASPTTHAQVLGASFGAPPLGGSPATDVFLSVLLVAAVAGTIVRRSRLVVAPPKARSDGTSAEDLVELCDASALCPLCGAEHLAATARCEECGVEIDPFDGDDGTSDPLIEDPPIDEGLVWAARLREPVLAGLAQGLLAGHGIPSALLRPSVIEPATDLYVRESDALRSRRLLRDLLTPESQTL